MGLYDETVEVPRKTMVLFFVVDTSGSMAGSKIGTLNSAIAELESELADISKENADAQIKIATLAFSTGAQWMESEPVEAENFRWNYLEAGGVTDLGEACLQLNEKLSRKTYMNEVAGSFAPVIFLLSDGVPTDDYRRGLEKLKSNNWFNAAIKVAVAIGDDADKSVLAEFTGNVEAVIEVHNPGQLKKWVRFISVTSAQIGSQSSSVGYNSDSGNGNWESGGGLESKQEQFIDELKEEVKREEADPQPTEWDPTFDDDQSGW